MSLAATGAAIVTFYVVAIVLPPAIALVAAQLVLAGVVLAIAGVAGLGLARPGARFVAAGVLVGASAWLLNLMLVDALGLTGQDSERLEELVSRPTLPYALATLALLPAVCEEIVFRGALARGLATRLPTWGAALVSAAVFSAYHLSPVQAVPTFTLGALLAVIAIRGGSIVPTMIAHAINNTAAIVLSRPEASDASDWLDAHAAIAAAVAGALCVAGLALAATGDPQ